MKNCSVQRHFIKRHSGEEVGEASYGGHGVGGFGGEGWVRETETTGYQPIALHAPVEWAIQGDSINYLCTEQFLSSTTDIY